MQNTHRSFSRALPLDMSREVLGSSVVPVGDGGRVSVHGGKRGTLAWWNGGDAPTHKQRGAGQISGAY